MIETYDNAMKNATHYLGLANDKDYTLAERVGYGRIAQNYLNYAKELRESGSRDKEVFES
jgi:hypothetical protein